MSYYYDWFIRLNSNNSTSFRSITYFLLIILPYILLYYNIRPFILFYLMAVFLKANYSAKINYKTSNWMECNGIHVIISWIIMLFFHFVPSHSMLFFFNYMFLAKSWFIRPFSIYFIGLLAKIILKQPYFIVFQSKSLKIIEIKKIKN